jgi:Protein of unknown function (DUF2034)
MPFFCRQGLLRNFPILAQIPRPLKSISELLLQQRHLDRFNARSFKVQPRWPVRMLLLRLLRTRANAVCRLSNSRAYATKATHTDLDSFLIHANSTNLSTTSTYYAGTLYEYTVLRALRSFNICLHRTGGTDDRGIDLRGRWILPHHTNYADGVPVLVQCKAEKKPIGPRYLRELEGATAAEDSGTLVLLSSLSRFTEGTRRFLLRSNQPMGCVLVNGYLEGGYVEQFIWNGAAGTLLGYELGVKTVYGKQTGDEDDIEKRLVLTWNGDLLKTKKNIPGET